MARLKVGDRARFISRSKNGYGTVPLGAIVTITKLSHFSECIDGSLEEVDYMFYYNGFMNGCDEHQLEPIIELGSWKEIEKSIKWNPTNKKESVK